MGKFRKQLALLIVFSLGLVLTLVGTSSISANGSNNNNPETQISFSSINGVIMSKNEIGINASRSLTNVSFDNVQMLQKNSNLSLQGELKYNDETYDISLTGPLYPMIQDSYFTDRLLLGDLSFDGTSSNFNFLQFTIERSPHESTIIASNRNAKDNVFLSLILENVSSGEVLILQQAIKEKDFFSLLEESKKNIQDITNDEHIDKVVNLQQSVWEDRKERRSIINNESYSGSSENSTLEGKEENSGSVKLLDNGKLPSIDRTELRRLIKDLEDNPYKTFPISDYDLPESLFYDIGFKRDNSGINNLHAYTFANPYGSYYTGISTVDAFEDHVSSPYGARIQIKLIDAIAVVYYPSTKSVGINVKERGMKFSDIDLALGKLADENVFNSQTANGLLNQKPNFLKALIAIIPYLQDVQTVWDGLDSEQTLALGQTEFYPSTFAKQKEDYDGSVIRNISVASGDLFLLKPGDFFNLHGGVSATNGYEYSWAWKYTVGMGW